MSEILHQLLLSIKRTKWLVVVFCAFLFVCTSIAVYNIANREKALQALDELAEAVEENTELHIIHNDSLPQYTVHATPQAKAEPVILKQYVELNQQNPDMFGWIKIEDTTLNYPVMHTPNDPERYLHTAFDGSDAVSGVPFLFTLRMHNDGPPKWLKIWRPLPQNRHEPQTCEVYNKKRKSSQTPMFQGFASQKVDGAGSGSRTRTVSLPLDFESSTSANSIIPAYFNFEVSSRWSF